MTLTTVVTKKAVVLQMPKLWNITLNMVCIDDTVEVINKDFSVRYRTGQDIEDKALKMQELMQAEIDKYNSEQQIFDHAKMDLLVTYLNNNLVDQAVK